MLAASASIYVTQLTPAAHAQSFSDGYKLREAVRKGDGAAANQILSETPSIVNSRDANTGETALLVAVSERKTAWVTYLLQHNADPDQPDKKGLTPLMMAVQINFPEAIETLIEHKATIDLGNRGGETALIRAVQLRNSAIVRLLVNAGANPDKGDALAGMSARDYAKDDPRAGSVLAIIERGPSKGDDAASDDKKQPDLDFSGIEDK